MPQFDRNRIFVSETIKIEREGAICPGCLEEINKGDKYRCILDYHICMSCFTEMQEKSCSLSETSRYKEEPKESIGEQHE